MKTIYKLYITINFFLFYQASIAQQIGGAWQFPPGQRLTER